MDLGSTGSEFTWQRGSIACHLDRVVVNREWRMLFSEAFVFHLPCFKSDHNPLWLQTQVSDNSHDDSERPFRFLTPWVSHDGFRSVVVNAWSEGDNWFRGLENFYTRVKE